MNCLAPVLGPLLDIVVRTWRHLCTRIELADRRWALREIHPCHPDRHYLEARVAQLERLQWL